MDWVLLTLNQFIWRLRKRQDQNIPNHSLCRRHSRRLQKRNALVSVILESWKKQTTPSGQLHLLFNPRRQEMCECSQLFGNSIKFSSESPILFQKSRISYRKWRNLSMQLHWIYQWDTIIFRSMKIPKTYAQPFSLGGNSNTKSYQWELQQPLKYFRKS